MEFGKWELRDNSYTSYYFSKDAIIYPSSNSVDAGKLHTEENVRNIYRDLTTKNFVTKYTYFSLSLNPGRNGVFVSPGEAVVQGYHFYTKNKIEVKVPDNTAYDSNGHRLMSQPIIQYTLGISLSYDAANHVTGDIVNKEGDIGESEILSGVYVAWFDECQLECNYNNILVLGRAWVQAGKIVSDGTIVNDRIIYHGFEADPFKDHRFEAKYIEVEVHGHSTTHYDTLKDNISQIHEPLYTYDSMHFPVELNRQLRTKPATHITDVQDYIDHVPDWYVSKYGDYMSGALRFNNLSIDGKREFRQSLITKDSINNDLLDSVIISPRTYGDLTRTISHTVENSDFDYNVGGTIMSVVPNSYSGNMDVSRGYTGIHAALISQMYGETGLRLHYGITTNKDTDKDSTDNQYYNTTRLVHYGNHDNNKTYNKYNNDNNTSKFIIENTDDTGRIASIDIKHGEIFIDSFATPENELYNVNLNGQFEGNHCGSGIQFFVSGLETPTTNNVDFRIDESKMSMASHEYKNHRSGTRGTQQLGQDDDTLHFNVGLGISYDISSDRNNTLDIYQYSINYENTKSPYLTLGNLRIRSNYVEKLGIDGNITSKQNTFELIKSDELPYIRFRPRIYTEQFLAEEAIQIGTSKYDDLYQNNAQNNTLDRIILKRVNVNNDNNTSFTYLEQDYSNGNTKLVLNKMMPTINNDNVPNFEEIHGFYSTGNVGCSSADKLCGKSGEIDDTPHEPYTDEKEWVRFTRFRYDNDKDSINSGTFTGNHKDNNGRYWGDTYNLEFNTNVANARANQIIWRYNGSTGTQDATTLNNTPPVVLSYIHDNPNANGTPTKYTNDVKQDGYNGGNGTFETWTDHAGNTHFNPTYKIRDFLMLENAGLVVAGDINNPSICGDSLNTNDHLGVTILAGRVYNAVYNDFAETYEKDDIKEIAQVGEIISLNAESGKYEICNTSESNLVVGVQSNTYAFLAGGNRVNNTQDVITLEHEYFTVGIAGKVWVRVINNSNIEPGNLLVSSHEKGKAMKSINNTVGTIIGKALTTPKYFEESGSNMVLMQIMLG